MLTLTQQGNRVAIDDVNPQIGQGRFPIKRIVGESVAVRASIFADGHDEVRAAILYRTVEENDWHEVLMVPDWNDTWYGTFAINAQVDYAYTVCGWVDEFGTWRSKLSKLWNA